ncbi:hypothetical protein [Clostridium sp. FP1]|uniref:hypothetical protein n=1 Tax=Clostridium sp. FP1 TaxID=2724076 RepID=UPI0013E95806|nr:hypothetical protein [Clostridium sp. FP1]MBZ9635154.1 hypothetical protein [Clostridium sp. FP1]
MKNRHSLFIISIILCFLVVFTSYIKSKGSIVMNQDNTTEITKKPSTESSYYELLSSHNKIRNIPSKTLKEIKSNMAYEEIIKKLGMTKDIGSGLFVAEYIVDDKLILSISFGNLNDKCLLDGDELLKEAKSF